MAQKRGQKKAYCYGSQLQPHVTQFGHLPCGLHTSAQFPLAGRGSAAQPEASGVRLHSQKHEACATMVATWAATRKMADRRIVTLGYGVKQSLNRSSWGFYNEICLLWWDTKSGCSDTNRFRFCRWMLAFKCLRQVNSYSDWVSWTFLPDNISEIFLLVFSTLLPRRCMRVRKLV